MRRVTHLCGVLVGAVLCTVAVTAGEVIHVDDNAPGDPGPGDPSVSDPLEDGTAAHPFDAIQEGINAAVGGDTVLVADGTYTGVGNRQINYGGRLITVRSANGPETCIIDLQAVAPQSGFVFQSGETAAAVLDGFTITNGNNLQGAAIIVNESGPTVTDCILSGNYSRNYGGAVYVWAWYTSPTTSFVRCTFIGNACAGASYHLGGGLYVGSHANAALVDCVFYGNTAGWGGGVACDSMWTVSLTHCIFVQNSAAQYGGGLDVTWYGASMDNCLFVGNHAGLYGGGVAAWEVTEPPTHVYVRDCTFAGNGATLGRSMACNMTTGGIWELYNCIAWEGSIGPAGEGMCFVSGVNATFDYCDVMGTVPGTGNIDADPLFVEAPDPGPDGVWGTADDDHGDLHLRAGSPCVDAAKNTNVPSDWRDLDGDGDTRELMPYDLDDHPRFVDDPDTDDTGVPYPPNYPQVVDMGAYEYWPIPGDFDHDGDVDLADFGHFQGCFNGPNRPPAQAGCGDADLDSDSDVDLSDFSTFRGCFNGPNRPPAC